MSKAENKVITKAANTKSKAEDERLIIRIKKGDYTAFEKLVQKYESRIYHHCLKFLNNKEDAEDILQDTFLQVYKSLETFRGDSAFFTWLLKIATNNCLMRLRKRKKVDLVSIDKPMILNGSELQREVVDWSQNPSLLCGVDEIRHLLNEAIAKLPEDKRVVLVLKDVEGFSNIEISEMLGMTVAAVKSRLHRARIFMREYLSEHLDGATIVEETGYRK